MLALLGSGGEMACSQVRRRLSCECKGLFGCFCRHQALQDKSPKVRVSHVQIHPCYISVSHPGSDLII